MLRAALLLLSGNLAASGLLFARNLALATLIPVSDYGIAATFALAMAAVEMASSFGLQQQIVQARDGDDPRLQDALTGFQVFRGVAAAILLFAMAGPLATFLGIPEVTWAYRILALVPLLNALQHFDIHRLNRDDRFGPLVATSTLPPLLAFILIWPLALWLGDWRAMLGAILLHAAAGAVMSHLVAERPWRPVFDRALWSRTVQFGWPILANAAVLFAVFQADKLAVGRIMGMAPLGVFAMSVTLTLTPSLIAAKTIQTMMLPRLSTRAGTDGFKPVAHQALTLSLVAGLALAVVGVGLGPMLDPWLAPTGYAALPALIGPLAIMQGLRIAKVGSGIVALSLGMTGNAVLANLPRVASLILGVVALMQGGSLLTLIWIGALGEVAGFALSLALLRRGIVIRWPMRSIAFWLGGMGLSATALIWPLAGLGAVFALAFLLRPARLRRPT